MNRMMTLMGIALLLMASFFSLCAADESEPPPIVIEEPMLRKIPVAVSRVKLISEGDKEAAFGESVYDVITSALDFTGYFSVVDAATHIDNPQETGIRRDDLNFKNWTGIGAEKLITSGVRLSDGIVEIEFWLFDAVEGKTMIGKRYSKYMATESDVRIMVHKFCGEVMRLLTGKSGVFGSRIAFESTTRGNKEIYSCEFDGNDPRQETFTKSITLSPSWSYDGNWLAYTSYQRGKADLYIKNLKQKRGSVVVLKGANLSPAWMPDRLRLAASLSVSGDPEIYMITEKGKVVKRLTRSWGIDISPSFSPDGKKMAFVSKRAGSPQIHVMDIGSGEVQRLTFYGKYNTSPSWSPVGDQIAFVGIVKNKINLFVINIDGSGLKQLTVNAGDNESPSWSPDGSMITFSSNRDGVSAIYVMTAYGTDQRRLLTLGGKQTNPEWSPKIVN